MYSFRRLRLALIPATVVVVILLAGCSAAGTSTGATSSGDGNPYNLITPGTIVATSSGDQPPFSTLDTAGKPSGFDSDLLQAVADELHLKIEYRLTTVDAGIQGLSSKQYDMVANGLGVTDERKAAIGFTKGIYWSSTAFLTKKSSKVTTPSDIAGLRTAVITGTVQVGYLAKIKGAVPVEYPNANAAVSALNSGTVDVFVIGSPSAEGYLKQFSDLKIAASAPVDHETALGVQHGNTALANAFDSEIGKMIDSGKYQEIYRHYFSQKPLPQLVKIWPRLAD